MLDGIDTGYEEKFDFPARQCMPSRPWLLATVPRTGSTYVSHMMWATGCLGAPLEYLNFEPAGPYGHAAGNTLEQRRIWNRVLESRTSPNGVLGLKAFPLQLEDLNRKNPPLVGDVMRLLFPPGRKAHVVQLRRRDREAHAVSYARALLSGIWRKEQEREGREEPKFSDAALESAYRFIEDQERAWTEMYAGLGITPHVLWYEDCLVEPDRAVRAVAGYLGVEIDPTAAIAVPQVERQARPTEEAWLARLGGAAR